MSDAIDKLKQILQKMKNFLQNNLERPRRLRNHLILVGASDSFIVES